MRLFTTFVPRFTPFLRLYTIFQSKIIMDQLVQTFYSDEDIYALMRIEFILSDSTDQPKRFRAGSESPADSHVAYPGHPPFSNNSMGMELMNSGFETLPVARSPAALFRLAFECGSRESLDTIGSPDYGPPSSVSDTSSSRHPTASSPQKDVPEDTIPATSQPSGDDCGGLGETTTPSGHNFVFSAPITRLKLPGKSQQASVDPFYLITRCPQGFCTNRHTTRYEDGEVLRYGAGESYRPFNNGNRDRDRSPPPRRVRSPLRARSPIRDRDRDLRARTPPIISDSYVPNRSPRRRSRSPDRYRGPDRARDLGGESWRRRDNSRARMRSPMRRMSPRRSPRRSPGRFSPGPRRDDRFDRARSPRRDFDIRDR